MNRTIYKIEHDDFDVLTSGLNISEYFPIQDNNSNKLVVNKLSLDKNKLFIETGFLKIMQVDNTNKKIYVELPQSHITFFNKLDELCGLLLSYLLAGETSLSLCELLAHIDDDNMDLENINYKYILEDDSNILKVNIFENTTIKSTNGTLSLETIKPDDMVGFVFGLDYISMLINSSPINSTSLDARTKLFCYYINVYKQHKYNPEPREIITDWNFSSKINSNNIFLKTNLTETDNIDVKTDIEQTGGVAKFNVMNLERVDEVSDNMTNNSGLSIPSETSSHFSMNSDNNDNNDNDNNELDNFKLLSSVIDNNISVEQNKCSVAELNTTSKKNTSKKSVPKKNTKSKIELDNTNVQTDNTNVQLNKSGEKKQRKPRANNSAKAQKNISSKLVIVKEELELTKDLNLEENSKPKRGRKKST